VTDRCGKILIANAWGNNRGDEAMLDVLSSRLQSLAPAPVEIDVAPYRDEIISLSSDARCLQGRYGTYRYSKWVRWLPSALSEHSFIHGPWTRRGARAFLQPYDVVLHAPQGPTIGDLYASKKYNSIFLLQISKELNIPCGMFGVSVGPFETYEQKVHDVLAHAQWLVFREDYSVQHVLQTYPEVEDVRGLVDLVFLADPEAYTREGLPPELRHRTADQIGMCISLTPSRDPRQGMDRDAYVEKIRRLIEYVHQQTGRQVYLLNHISSEGNRQARRLLANHPTLGEFTTSLEDVRSWKDQMRLIDNFSFYISSRYHPTIFSILQETPLFCIKNQFKVEGMLKKIGLQLPVCWQHDHISAMKSCFDRCWDGRLEHKERIIKARERGQQIALRYDTSLTSVLDASFSDTLREKR